MVVAPFCEYIVIAVQCESRVDRWDCVRRLWGGAVVKGWPGVGGEMSIRSRCDRPARVVQGNERIFLYCLERLTQGDA